jgi:hypothetical protein
MQIAPAVYSVALSRQQSKQKLTNPKQEPNSARCKNLAQQQTAARVGIEDQG